MCELDGYTPQQEYIDSRMIRESGSDFSCPCQAGWVGMSRALMEQEALSYRFRIVSFGCRRRHSSLHNRNPIKNTACGGSPKFASDEHRCLPAFPSRISS